MSTLAREYNQNTIRRELALAEAAKQQPTYAVARHSAGIGPMAGTTHLVVTGNPRTPCGLSIVMVKSRDLRRPVASIPNCARCAAALRRIAR